LLAVWYLDTWGNANTASRAITVLSIVKEHTLQVDSLHEKTMDISLVNGHYYSDKAPLPVFLTVPVYAAYYYMFDPASGSFDTEVRPVYLIGDIVCGSLSFVVICMIFYHYAKRYTTETNAAFLSMALLYPSFIFVFSGTFFSHVLAAALMLFAYVLLKEEKRHVLSGLFAGAAMLTEYSLGLIVIVWLLQIWFNEKDLRKCARFIAGTIPSFFVLAVYNYSTTGSMIDVLYNHEASKEFANASMLGFSHPTLESLYGLSISPFRGLFFYCPALLFILIVCVVKRKWTAEPKKNYVLWVSILFFLLIASHKVWWGGWSYGPRQLMPIAVLLLFEGGTFLAKSGYNRILFSIWTALWLLVTWVAKSTVVYSVPTEEKNPFLHYFPDHFIAGPSNECNILSAYGGVSPFWSGILWLILMLTALLYYMRRSAN
jgi:hypothetical protein